METAFDLTGFTVRVVEPGTEIEDPATGSKITVTETACVFRGRDIFIVQAGYDALKAFARPA